MDDPIPELTLRLQDAQGKYSYFMIALAGACVAFAVQSTSDELLDWTLLPAGIAVLLWAASIATGITNRLHALTSTHRNIALIKLQRAITQGADVENCQRKLDKLKRLMDKGRDAGAHQFTAQLWTFYGGAIAFIVWHVIRIAANTPSTPT